jgi:hypothetical protein
MTSITLELKGIDLSAIDAARGGITAALANPNLQHLLDGDVFETALGSLGSAMGSLKTSSPDAAALLKPIADAAGSLITHLNPSSLNIADYAKHATEGLGIVIDVIKAMQTDPAQLGKLLPIGSITGVVDQLVSGFGASGSVGQFHSLIDRVENGVPAAPDDFAKLALEILLPFPGGAMFDLRAGIDAIFSASASITLPDGRMGGLLAALDAVVAAAANPQQLAKALAEVARVRKLTIDMLVHDLTIARDAIDKIDVGGRIAPLLSAMGSVNAAQHGFLEIMDEWRAQLRSAKVQVEGFDPKTVRPAIEGILKFLEDQARLRIEKPIDEQVIVAEQFVRDLFARLPVRRYRNDITAFLMNVANEINEAHLDRVAEAINKAIDDVANAVDPQKLAAEVQALLGDLKQQIDAVIGAISAQLKGIVTAISNVSAALKGVLDKVKAVLEGFAASMKEITDAIDTLGVEEAAQQVVAAVRELRDTAEKLLSAAPIPEPMRGVVEQLTSTLETIDFEMLFAPVRAVVEKIRIPAEVAATINSALKEVGKKLETAIPATLVASLDAEVGKALEQFRKFDPSKLLDGVKKYLNEAADFFEKLDPTAAAKSISGPFQKLLDAIDAAQPRKLLAPVISAYDGLLKSIPEPSAGGSMQAVADLINNAGNAVASKITKPIENATGGTANTTPGASTPAPPAAPVTESPFGGSPKPGDVIRVLGWLPAKLHEGLKKLESGAAIQALQKIDSVTGGLARDLRIVRARVLEIDARIDRQLSMQLSAVGQAQLRAQAAVSIHAAPGVDVSVSLNAIAIVNPGEIRQELQTSLDDIRTRGRDAVDGLAGSIATQLQQAATALDKLSLTSVVSSLDDFLAALDPEPIAAELDALAEAAIKKLPELLTEAGKDLELAIEKLKALLAELNPAVQAQKFFKVIDILREELDLFNPGRLADELGMIHAAIRADIAAYDPRVLAAHLAEKIHDLATKLRNLKAKDLIGELALFADIIKTIETANPAVALKGIGTELAEVGEDLKKVDPAALLASINALVPKIEHAFETAIKGIVAEIIALLESIRYASANVSVKASGSLSA